MNHKTILDAEAQRLGVNLSDSRAVARAIRAALSQRSAVRWSVTCGRGAFYGWISIDIPKSIDEEYRGTKRKELSRLLGCDGVNPRAGHTIPAARDYRAEYLARARGEQPSVKGVPYWD